MKKKALAVKHMYIVHIHKICSRVCVRVQCAKSNRVNCVRNYIKYSCDITPIKWIITWVLFISLSVSPSVDDELRHVKNQAIASTSSVLVHINFVQSSIINLLKYIQIKMLLRFFASSPTHFNILRTSNLTTTIV